jgi:microcystin degradation protein MlrC
MVNSLVLAEKRPGVINATIVHGFSGGDCADMGTKVLVTADNDKALAVRTAAEIGTKLQSLRERAQGRRQDLAAALRSAAASKRFPVILADTNDNPGGGNAGDDMTILRALRDANMAPACGGPIWDPQAARFCFEAGIGARISLRVGGKAGPGSGPPLDLEGEVIGLRRDATQPIGGFDAPLGDIAAFKAEGLTLVLSTLRDQAYDPALFEQVGIDLITQRFIVVKSSQQFRIGFEPRAGRIISVSRPRKNLIYHKRPRPMWPFERDTSEDVIRGARA